MGEIASKYRDDVLKLREQGWSYREIEEELGCSRGTISYHCNKKDVEDIGLKPKHNEEYNTEVCPICESEFQAPPSAKRIYCSWDCYKKDDECEYRDCAGGGYRENSTIKHRSKYKGFQMDSGAEKRFAQLLDEEGVRWVKNKSEYFEYEDQKGKQRKYYPDFYLPNFDLWVEIKAKYYETERINLKLNSVPNIEIIYDKNIHLPQQVAE